jgi:hypothetical protein
MRRSNAFAALQQRSKSMFAAIERFLDAMFAPLAREVGRLPPSAVRSLFIGF